MIQETKYLIEKYKAQLVWLESLKFFQENDMEVVCVVPEGEDVDKFLDNLCEDYDWFVIEGVVHCCDGYSTGALYKYLENPYPKLKEMLEHIAKGLYGIEVKKDLPEGYDYVTLELQARDVEDPEEFVSLYCDVYRYNTAQEKGLHELEELISNIAEGVTYAQFFE